MAKTKVKKIKAKTHKASAKRFRVTGTGIVMHRSQGDNGHSKNYESRRQKRNPRRARGLRSVKEANKIKRLLGK